MGESFRKIGQISVAVLVGGGTQCGKAFCPCLALNGCLSLAPRIDKLEGLGGIALGPPRSDWPDRAECRARPAQRALTRHFSSNRRELSHDRRTRRLAQHLAPDRD